MSQKKTVVPGMNSGDDYRYQSQAGSVSGNYARPRNGGGTVCPGMDNRDAMAGDQGGARRHNLPSGKPIVGFLYSVSRTAVGEYWPVHIGQNVIGSSSECDIVLNEGTVSQRHAILHINKMKKPEKVEATISDCQSTNGTMVNGNSVSVARPPECVNGDIITIGENYELLFILIDVKAIGLTQSEEFIALEEKGEDMYTTGMSMSVFADERSTRNEQDFPPRFSGPESPYSGQNRPIDGTVGMDPGSNSFSGGGTVGM